MQMAKISSEQLLLSQIIAKLGFALGDALRNQVKPGS